ncbi:antibiotic biosynthesis monooxygenase [Streptomyces sp. AC563]|uniref:antibiotic biosynthesis monooxygenase family protein n=1 Tax=Streptomyces buecherae TaxID=2763006 RepID=UPI00164EA574|nr:antibiotic biosynthesis monooxygenase family protein [Streptomyces buecherae]MBC3991818.1 antibiotic biosynthesis monooxygenase [Streptomyces buecherae]
MTTASQQPTPETSPASDAPDTPVTSVTPDTSVTFINVFEIDAEHLDGFLARWQERAALMSTKPGFLDSRLHRARSSQTRFQLVNVSHWASEEEYAAAGADPEFQRRTKAASESTQAPVVPNPGLYDVAVEFVGPAASRPAAIQG